LGFKNSSGGELYMKFKFFGWIGIFLLIFFFTASVNAAIYYVDQNHPLASDNNPGTEDLPWKTINHAAEVLQAGDTVLVKEGRYNVGASPGWEYPAINPANSGTPENPITFKVYPGHNVTVFVSEGQAAIGSNGKNYIIWDGFTVEMFGRMKGILLHTTKGCVIQNCEVIGDYIPTTDNHDGIRVDVSEDIIVRNCIISGVKGDSVNSSGIKCYAAKGLIVENCEIYDCYTGITDKSAGRYNVYRKNIIHDIGPGPSISLYTQDGFSTEGIEINQNIIYNSPNIYFDCDHPMEHKNVKIYNNVFHNVAIDSLRSPNLQIWNNIFYNTDFSVMARINGTPTYSNFNCFYPTAKFETGRYTDNDVIYNSLSEWQNGTSQVSFTELSFREASNPITSDNCFILNDQESFVVLPRPSVAVTSTVTSCR